MSFVDERISIENRFYVLFGMLNPSIQIAWEGRVFERPDPSVSWVSFMLLNGSEGEQVTLGENPVHRRISFIQVNIHVQAGLGAKAANAIADLIEPIFTGKSFLAGLSGGIYCRTSSIKPLGVRDGKYTLIFSVPYHYDTITESGNSMLTAKMKKYLPNETPDGIITDFTFSGVPSPESFQLFLNGMLQSTPLSYTLIGNTVSFLNAPEEGWIIEAYF